MTEIFHDAGADLSLIQSKKIAIIGYGLQDHVHILNLRDSGVEVVVGPHGGPRSIVKAEEQGPEVVSVTDAVAQVDVIMVLTPDQSQRAIWTNDIEPNLRGDATVFLARGFNVHYDYVEPGPTYNVCMVALKDSGHTVCRLFGGGRGVPSLVRVEQDAFGQASELVLSYTAAIGAVRAGVVRTTFREETETDLLDEQAVLCGGVSQLTQCGLETLVEAGCQPEMVYSEVCHEMKLIIDLTNEDGLTKQHWSCSDTTEYSNYVSGPRVIRPDVKDHMREVLADIQNGSSAKCLVDDQDAGVLEFLELRAKGIAHPIEKTGQEIRKLLAWSNSNLDEDYTDGEAAH